MIPVSFDGNAINDGTNYRSYMQADAYTLPAVQPRIAPRTGRWPLLSSLERRGRQLHLGIIILGTPVSTLQNQIYRWFDPEDEAAKKLIIEDLTGGNDRYVYAICNTVVEDAESDVLFHVSLTVHGDVRWRENTPATDSWNITASGQTKNLTNNGRDDAYPILTITPTSTKTNSYAYKRFMAVRWQVDEIFVNYPVDIGDNALDTAALVGGGKMQADGDDLRVWVNGAEVDRWLDDINTNNTSVWINLDFQAQQEATLEAAIAGSGSVDTIDVNEDISGFPNTGILKVNSEIFTYTGKNNDLKRFTGVTRAMRGTSMGAHSASDTIWWVQHDIWILYGYSGASAPTVDDNVKPAFALATSTNTIWDYDEFGENDLYRTAQWLRIHVYGGTFYGGNHGASAALWVELGLRGGLYTKWGPEETRFALYNPCGITAANYQNGEKYVEDDYSGYWEGSTQKAGSDGEWVDVYKIIAPSVVDTWEAWATNDTGLTDIQYVAIHNVSVRNYIECADVTVTLDSTYTPAITIGAEQGNYSLECTIVNNTTGKSIELSYIMELNEDLELNTDEKTVIYLLDNTHQFQAFQIRGEPRRDWLALQPGVNELEFVDAGTNAVTIAFEWEERHYL